MMWQQFTHINGTKVVLNLNNVASIMGGLPTEKGEPTLVVRYGADLKYSVLGDIESVLVTGPEVQFL